MVIVLRSTSRAEVFQALYDHLLAMGNTSEVWQAIAATWRGATTRAELLAMAEIAYPLIAHDSTLGREMVAAFAWVDDQLREG